MAKSVSDSTILILDQDPRIRNHVREALQPHGFDVLEAADRNDALRLLRARKVSVAIVGYGDPGESSSGSLEAIRKQSDEHSIVLTAEKALNPEDLMIALKHKVRGILYKPFTQEDCVGAIQHLQRKGTEGSVWVYNA